MMRSRISLPPFSQRTLSFSRRSPERRRLCQPPYLKGSWYNQSKHLAFGLEGLGPSLADRLLQSKGIAMHGINHADHKFLAGSLA